MLKERIPLYKKNADFTVITDDSSAAKVAEENILIFEEKGNRSKK